MITDCEFYAAMHKTDKTLITCLLIFLFSIGNDHFNDIWAFVEWISFIGIAWLCNCQKLGDEYHYVLECSSLNNKAASSKIFYEKT